MLGLITDAQTAEPMSLHRTVIQQNGEKTRTYLPGHPKKGGVIRLWDDEYVTTGLAIAEGIETALSVATEFLPVWSCLDAGNLSEFPVLPGITSLTIFADHDDAGIDAAHKCADRWHKAGREVRIAMSPVPGEDANDVLRRVV